MQITSEIEDKLFTHEVLVIAHTPCIDGFCSAFIFKTYLDWLERRENRPINSVFVGGNHASKLEKLPDVRGKVVFILDFSYPRKTLVEMKQKAAELVVLDHHASAQKDLAGLPYCLFDMTRSGATLTADYVGINRFVKDEDLPSLALIASYVADRDLWKYELPESKLLNLAIGSWPYKFSDSKEFTDSYKLWRSYSKKPFMDFMHDVAFEGTIVGRQMDKMTDDAVGFAKLGQLFGRTELVPVVNVYPHVVSETLHRLLEEYDCPYAIGWYFDGKKYVYSLRSGDDFDVSELAKKYAGGGHKKAAGFSAYDFYIETVESSFRADLKKKRELGFPS